MAGKKILLNDAEEGFGTLRKLNIDEAAPYEAGVMLWSGRVCR